jgi:hypothetical protein
MQRSKQKQHDAGLTANSVRFRRHVRVQGNRPRASRVRANGVGAVQEQRAGDTTKHGDPAGGYAGMPDVFQQHTCVSREGSAREQEDLKVRGGVGIANPSGSIVSSQGSTTSSSSYSSSIAKQDHKSPWRLPLRPSSTHGNPSRQTSSSSMESHHRQAFLFADPIATGLHFPRVLLHNQGYPKVCPNSLNLLNVGDSFAGISPLTSCYLFSWT